MARRANARRYAQAVFDIALEKGELEGWQSDLGKIAGLGEDAALITLLETPKLDFDEKAKLLSKKLGDINPLALNLVYLLVARGSLNIIEEITEEYQRLLNDHQGIVEAEVVTAVPLDDEEKSKMGQRLGAVIGKEVVVRPTVDSGVVGGVVVRIGGKLLDGSTRSQLKALKRELGGSAR